MAANANHHRQERLECTTTLAQRVRDQLAAEHTGSRTVKQVADGFLDNAIGTMGATSAMVRGHVVRVLRRTARGSGTWSVYFDGTARGLVAPDLDIDAFDVSSS